VAFANFFATAPAIVMRLRRILIEHVSDPGLVGSG
jgi:hypothetical protein